VPAIWRLL
jgi:hypothetical protein